MADSQMFAPEERLELIEGEIIQMSPMGSRHAECVSVILRVFQEAFKGKGKIRSQNPISLSKHSEPQPDIALVFDKKYDKCHPQPKEIHLIIEVSDTTYVYDKTVKMPLYADSGILEFWIVNLNKNEIEVYTNPGKGNYQKRQVYKKRGIYTFGKIACIAFPDTPMDLSEAF